MFTPSILKALKSNGIDEETFFAALDEPHELTLELLQAQGLDIRCEDGVCHFATAVTHIDDATFCIVDVETNGSKPGKHQIIEIGAVKVCNGSITDTFESLVHCKEISRHISEITGITAEDTADAPSLKEVMQEFRLFLGTDIFVAHDVKFDYSFISAMMERVGLEALQNRALCTIDLTERTISSYRYGLAYLNEQLELYKEATHHRALSDAVTAAKLFKRVMKFMPEEVKTAEDMIRFSKEAKRLKRPKFDPALSVKKEEKE